MLNDEIGTYQIAQAIAVDSELVVKVDGRKIITKINGSEFVGNWDIIKKICKTSKLKKRAKVKDNLIVIKQSPKDVLKNVYGITEELDWEKVYDADSVWSNCMAISNTKSIKKQSNFKLDDNRGSI